eukprot:TRINITY_DN19680_c0_g1_i1.p1 TRINITY_DN19680_c0_g1~~TRINITY_DN19680_c0_g1_i1.p1  ORF type:complete len:536 (+),score=95.18 TRINITY_DN19680_c0_g1_i1:68-1675(+)
MTIGLHAARRHDAVESHHHDGHHVDPHLIDRHHDGYHHVHRHYDGRHHDGDGLAAAQAGEESSFGYSLMQRLTDGWSSWRSAQGEKSLRERSLQRVMQMEPAEEATRRQANDERQAGEISAEDNPKLAASKVIAILTKIDDKGYNAVEGESIYGAAVAIPQIARSAGWPGTLMVLVIRVYFFTLFNFLLQGFLLSMIGEEQLMWYPFAGQMHLCDFGAQIKDCPDAANCRGPLGTKYTASRLYDFDIWSTRIFVKQSLQALFPEKAEELDMKVDPGEYGIENSMCRLACIFLFMLAVVDDLEGTILLAKSLWFVPWEAESWISYSVPQWGSKDDVKTIQGLGELDLVSFNVAGIPTHWKIINFVFILVPKSALWLGLVKSGVHYLMETAGIVNVIVNAMALTFVLEVDEMLFHRFTNSLTKHIMLNLTDMPRFNTDEEEEETDQEALDRFRNTEFGDWGWSKLSRVVPVKFFAVLVLQVVFLLDYYNSNCVTLEDGSRISQALSAPGDLTYRPFSLMFGLEDNLAGSTVWTMPDE